MIDIERIDAYIEKIEKSEKEVFPSKENLKVGVDLGTAYIVIVVLDQDDNTVACERQAASVIKDGVVVDYTGALRIVKQLKEKLEQRIGSELCDCAIAMPPGTYDSVQTHKYVAEGAGFNVVNVLDEPMAANAVYCIENGAVVDIGGGTTGIAVFKNCNLVRTADEPTGGTHLSLVLAGNFKISFEEAEIMKQDFSKHAEILPIVRPVIEKMAHIVMNNLQQGEVSEIYLCGGTCLLTGIEKVFKNQTGITTIVPANPFLVTPAGIAMNCIPSELPL